MKKLQLFLASTLVLAFVASMGHAQILNSESFDGTSFPPPGWTASTLVGGTNWTSVTSGGSPTCLPHSGARMAYYNSYNASSGYQAMLVTPAIDYSGRGANTPTASFWMYRYDSYSGYYDDVEVLVNTSPNVTGALLLGTIYCQRTKSPPESADGWYQYTTGTGVLAAIPASYSTGTNYIIFRATSDYGDNTFIDDVSWISYPSGPMPPTAFTAQMTGPTNITLNWTKNAANNDVMVVVNTVNTFGTPVDGNTYAVGTTIPGGGTVLYVGSGTSAVFTGNPSTQYYFRVYSKTPTAQYSSSYAATSIVTPATAPYFEGFEGITANNQFPTGWVVTADARSYTGPQGSYNRAAHTGVKFASFYYSPSGVGSMVTSGIYLEGGKTYNGFLWYVADAYSGWYSLSLKYGPTPSVAAMTQIPGATVSNPMNTTYQRLAGQFTPITSGMYYIAIVCDHNTVPYYLSVDDLAINDFPQKNIAVTSALLRDADSTWARGATRRHTVQAVIQNLGWEDNPSSIPFTYTDGTTIVNETVTPVWNGSTGVVTFTTKYVPQLTGTKTITVTANYPGDADATNNSQFFTATIQNVKVIGYADFDRYIVPGFGYDPALAPDPFVVTDLNGGNTFRTSAGTGIGGSQAVEYPGDVQPANDWLVLPAAGLTAGSSYRFRLQYASQSGLPQNMQFFYGQSPNVATMQPMVNGMFANFTNTAFKESGDAASGTYPYFNTTTETNYYIGIKVTSAANSGKVLLDNMLFDVNPAPPPKIGYRYESPATAPYIDDASLAKIDLSAIYRNPGIIDRRYQVTNTTGLFGVNGFMLWNVTTATPWIKLVMDPAGAIPQTNPYSPAWPRENQYFRLVIDPTLLQPGTYNGSITLYASLWNNDRPTSGPGLAASNQPFVIPVNLTVSTNGSGGATTPNAATGTNFGVGPHALLDGAGNKIAIVTVTSGLIGSITVTEYPNQMPPNYSRLRYVRKYWTITANGTGWTADVQFFYSDPEALAGGVVNRDNLRGWNQTGKSAWVYAGAGSTSDPATNSVTVQGLNPANIAGTFACATRWNHTPKTGADGRIAEFGLSQNYPNPFNPSTKIEFTVPDDGPVTLTVFNSLGVEVATLVNEALEAGSYGILFDASALPAGTYVYRLTAGSSTETRTMSLVK